MFSNAGLDVFIGLTFIFLLYSLLATILQEILARIMGMRARILAKGLRRMLEDGDKPTGSTLINSICDFGMGFYYYFKPMEEGSFLKAFYNYPLIKYLGENTSASKPSYLSAANFSEAIVHLLRGDGFNNSSNQMELIQARIIPPVTGKQGADTIAGFTINAQTRRYLKHLFIDAQMDVDKFRLSLESWFNVTMERATGWYKRQVQLMLMVIGLGLAIYGNVDAIAIAKILAKDKNTREQLVQLAGKKNSDYLAHAPLVVNGKPADATDKDLSDMYQALKNDDNAARNILGLDTTSVKQAYQKDDILKWLGYLATALAISLGAPFWFDLLNKFMMLRGSSKQPDPPGATDKTIQQKKAVG